MTQFKISGRKRNKKIHSLGLGVFDGFHLVHTVTIRNWDKINSLGKNAPVGFSMN